MPLNRGPLYGDAICEEWRTSHGIHTVTQQLKMAFADYARDYASRHPELRLAQ